MKQYVALELKFVKFDEDIVTASLVSEGHDANEGDLVTPNTGFWG